MNAAGVLALLWLGPLASLPTDAEPEPRPYGAVMGDGLDLRIDPNPPAGGVCAPGDTVFGIDVSYYQGDIDWQAVAASGVKFAIVRVSHSLQFFDPQFEANIEGARAAGIHTGVYQYFEPDEDPVAQADLLLDALGPLLPGDLPPMIDVESTGGQSAAAINDAIHAWIDRVESTLGVKPIVYSGYYFWNDNVGSSDFGEYPLMLPWYGVECPGGVPIGWDMWTIHQYCDCGSVGGIGGNVDVNRFNGDLAALEALASSPECGDAVCSGGEDPYTCPADCEPCGVIPAAGGTIDNGAECYRLYGDSAYWHEEAQGEGGSLLWTHATDYDVAYNYAVWQLHFEESGRYDVQAHIVQPFGASAQAGYLVRHAEGESTVVVDQSTNDGWVSLGEFEFEAATDHTLQLDDNTGDSPDLDVMLVYDAIKLVRLDAEPSTTSDALDDSGGGPSTTSGGGEESSSGPGMGTDATDTDSDSGPSLPGARGEEQGCGCRAPARPGGGLGALVLLAGFALRRRRRRATA
jgi:MYXO-CTERM domain-containing protein